MDHSLNSNPSVYGHAKIAQWLNMCCSRHTLQVKARGYMYGTRLTERGCEGCRVFWLVQFANIMSNSVASYANCWIHRLKFWLEDKQQWYSSIQKVSKCNRQIEDGEV